MSRIDNATSYLLGMNTGDLETALAAFAEDATYYGFQRTNGTYSRKLHASKDELRAYISDWLKTATHGITYEIVSAEQFGNDVVVHWHDYATGEGETYENDGVNIFEFNDQDQIIHSRAYQAMGPLETWSFLDH